MARNKVAEKTGGAIKIDNNNARRHPDQSKKSILESLSRFGAGRSILLDANNTIIAGNGVFEQAQKLGIPVKIIETDGNHLIAVKRKDLKTRDKKRKALALADNQIAGLSEWDEGILDKQLAELNKELRSAAGFIGKQMEEVKANIKKTELPQDIYQVLCECENEAQQKTIYDLLNSEGYKCRLITL
jgi:hypothetical protein